MRIMTAACVVTVVGCTALGCRGTVVEAGRFGNEAGGTDQTSGSGGSAVIDSPRPDFALARVRRLTLSELKNSISAIYLGGAPFLATFSPEPSPRRFDNNIQSLSVTADLVENLEAASEAAAAAVAANLNAVFSCDVVKRTEIACARSFVEVFGRRTYRRRLTEAEINELVAIFSSERTNESYADSLALIVETMLQSPHFLFRSELGPLTATKSERVRLDPYEIASELSYFLWRSTPDDALLDAADNGTLLTSAGIAKEAARLLNDKRGQQGARDFLMEWLELDDPSLEIKTDGFYTPAVGLAMRDQAKSVVDNILFAQNGSIVTLFSSNVSFANKELANIIGIGGPSDQNLTMVTLDSSRAAGVLGLNAFINTHSASVGFSPIFFGLFVRRKLLCQALPNPPANVPFPTVDPNVSTRERYSQHAVNSCKSCHTLMDPVGYGFENYDSLGRFHATELVAGKPLTLSGQGELTGTDVDGVFVGPHGLGERLGRSAIVADCLARQLLSFVLGRSVTTDPLAIDETSAAAIVDFAKGADGSVNLKKLIAAAAISESFVFRNTTQLSQGGGQ